MFEEKISLSAAQEEVNKWLDAKHIDPKRRDKLAEPIDVLVSAIQYGQMSIDDKNIINYKLHEPIKDAEGGLVIEDLSFKPRLSVLDIQNNTKGLKADDQDGRIVATMSALTGKPAGILRKMDTSDNRTCEAVTVFFL